MKRTIAILILITTLPTIFSSLSSPPMIVHMLDVKGNKCGTLMDDTALIQSILNTASPSLPLVLIMDCFETIDTRKGGLVLKGDVTVRGL